MLLFIYIYIYIYLLLIIENWHWVHLSSHDTYEHNCFSYDCFKTIFRSLSKISTTNAFQKNLVKRLKNSLSDSFDLSSMLMMTQKRGCPSAIHIGQIGHIGLPLLISCYTQKSRLPACYYASSCWYVALFRYIFQNTLLMMNTTTNDQFLSWKYQLQFILQLITFKFETVVFKLRSEAFEL